MTQITFFHDCFMKYISNKIFFLTKTMCKIAKLNNIYTFFDTLTNRQINLINFFQQNIHKHIKIVLVLTFVVLNVILINLKIKFQEFRAVNQPVQAMGP